MTPELKTQLIASLDEALAAANDLQPRVAAQYIESARRAVYGSSATPAAGAAPASDALLRDLTQLYADASPVQWAIEFEDSDEVFIFEDENGDGIRPNPYHPICRMEDMGDDKAQPYAILIKELVNAAPALLARVAAAETRVAAYESQLRQRMKDAYRLYEDACEDVGEASELAALNYERWSALDALRIALALPAAPTAEAGKEPQSC